MEEIVELSDRAVTLYQGRINAEFARDEITQDNLMAAAFGVTERKQVVQ
jgi:AI-2 transport system ATP-binding protein